MSLSINSAKVKQKLDDINALKAESQLVVWGVINGPVTAEVFGSVSVVVPPEFEKARERLLTLRRHLEEKGEKFLSADELDREIDEARGR